jgi:hypothetical protein
MNAETALVMHEARPLDNYRMSTDAAGACREIVVATASTIQGRKFVSVEGWQAIAIAHGCVAGARDVERIEGGVRAIGEVRRMSDGNLIAVAEGFVGEDEPTWYGGQSRGKTLPKRADYAIRAMAQTRAISRACRSAFAHVVVMMKANLETTPAAEVPPGGFDDTPHNPQTGEIIEAQVEKIPGITKIRERLRAFMIAGNKTESLEEFRALKRANKDDLKAIRDGNHPLWTGDGSEPGEGDEGFEKWMARRIDDLTPPEESVAYQLLVSTLAEVETKMGLQEWLRKNGDVVESLDGAEGRKFEEIYAAKESGIAAMDQVSA